MPLGLLKVTKWATSGGHKNTEKEVTMAESASSQSLLPLSATTPLSPNDGEFIDQSSMCIKKQNLTDDSFFTPPKYYFLGGCSA